MAGRRAKGTRQSRFNKRRKGMLSVIIPWTRRFGALLAVLSAAVWMAVWLHLSGTLGRAADWTQDRVLTAGAGLGFAIENIMVEGRQYTDAGVLLAIVNVEKGDPLFGFNPRQAQELMSQISWVARVQVERRWPDTIYIGLTERAPLALWQTDKRVKLLDAHGEVIVTDRLERFAGLLMVTGRNAPEHAPQLVGNLSAETLVRQRVETARRVGGRRWDLRLKNGIEVRLPEDDMGLALRRLAAAQRNDGLLDKDILSIDLRESDRISIRTKPGAVQDYTTGRRIDAAAADRTGSNI